MIPVEMPITEMLGVPIAAEPIRDFLFYHTIHGEIQTRYRGLYCPCGAVLTREEILSADSNEDLIDVAVIEALKEKMFPNVETTEE